MHPACIFLLLVPVPISGIAIVSEIRSTHYISVTITWEEAVGIGPEYVIDYYSITVTPPTIDGNSSFEVTLQASLSISIKLTYNVEHIVDFFAVNCVGLSEPISLIAYYSKLVRFI